MKKYLQRILSLFLIFSLILPLAACSDGTGAALRYDISTVITNLDPQYADGEDAKMVIRNVFERLFCYDEEGKACLLYTSFGEIGRCGSKRKKMLKYAKL